jgi:hypothetical protein
MACHDQIAHLFSDGVFFAYPGRPWERPSNENTNGLLRQYFPKRTDLSVHGAEDLEAVEQRLNNRPAKRSVGSLPLRCSLPAYPRPDQRCDDRANPPRSKTDPPSGSTTAAVGTRTLAGCEPGRRKGDHTGGLG